MRLVTPGATARALLASVLLAAAGLGCKSVSAPQSAAPARSDDAGPDAGHRDAGSEDRCSEGALRCRKAARQRERCEDGHWTPAADCSQGEVCGAGEGEALGKCLAVADVCRGSGGSTVCDGTGVMYHCGTSGVVESSARCESARHCQLGIRTGQCARCLPGEYRCSGAALEVCDDRGESFRRLEDCAADSCDAEAGLCRGESCSEGRSICRGDVLEICSPDAGEYRPAERCAPGLCNAAAGRCDVCLPGARSCEGNSAVTCASDGSSRERASCAGDTPHCVGAGQCVQCSRDADCSATDACSSAYCDLVRGVCEPEPLPAGTPCPSGLCNGEGECATCLEASDCPEPAACLQRHCEAQACRPRPLPEGTRCGTGVCDGSGFCAGCSEDDDCPSVGECQVRRCDPDRRTCMPEDAADGQRCRGSFGTGLCFEGQCVECGDDADCPAAAECRQAFCRSSDHSCQERPAEVGAACGGGQVCDGASGCVQCANDAHCPAHASCRDSRCSCNSGSIQSASGDACELDACAKFDDNRCGVSEGTGNRCTPMPGGTYACQCAAGWTAGDLQCFQGGSGAGARSVPNLASWNVVPEFGVVCDNALDTQTPCTAGQLTWINLCGLPDTNPADCSVLIGLSESLATVSLQRVAYSGPLEDFGELGGAAGSERILLPAVGDVVLVQSLAALYVMRITSLEGNVMTYEWAMLWRDTCWRPGGASCTAACSCPDAG